jgi:uncharacterized hydrophobic protein (TIGR00271 family)
MRALGRRRGGDVLSSNGSTEPRSPIAQTALGSFLHGGPVGRVDLDEIADKLWFDRERGRDPYVRFGTLLVLSVVIATGGVLGDSTATVIGAMIVAPLMTPIMASALAVVTGDAWHLWRSLAIVAIGVATAIGLSWLLGVASSVVVDATTNSQVAGRVSPRLSDLVVALASGAAGGFALSRRNVSDALPGVAIAISLVPPLCVVGVMLANGDPSASMGAMLLFLTNFLAILVAGGGVLAIMGYGRVAFAERHAGRRASAIVITLATLLIAIPLAITGARVASDTRIEFAIRSRADDVLRGTGVDLATVDASGDTVEVTLEGSPDQGVAVARDVASRIHEARPDLRVRVALVDSQVVEILPSG